MKKRSLIDGINLSGYLALVLMLFLGIIQYSCNETLAPEQTPEKRTLTVRTMLTDQNTGKCTPNPATPSFVSLRYINDKGVEVAFDSVQVNGQGEAVFQLEAPVTGVNFFVTGYYNLQYSRFPQNGYQLMCSDTGVTFCFSPDPPPFVECPNIPQIAFDLVFADENNNTLLSENSPFGIAEYYISRDLFYNNGTQPVTVTIPTMQAPFRIVRAEVNGKVVTGNQVVVQPGQTFTVVFGVSTVNVGTFQAQPIFNLKCQDGTTQDVTVDLSAEVIEISCNCPPSPDSLGIVLNSPVEVGTSMDINTLIFDNNLDCDLRIISITPFSVDLKEWKLISPTAFPLLVEVGTQVEASLRFTPMYALMRPQTFEIRYILESGDTCKDYFVVSGEGCVNDCAYISTKTGPKYPQDYVEFSNKEIRDSLQGNAGNGRIEFSPNTECSTDSAAVIKLYTVFFPDSICCEEPLNVNITIDDKEVNKNSLKYFSVFPSSLIMSKNSPTALTVAFKAPTLEDFNSLFLKNLRKKTGTVADSTFEVYITLTSTNCNNCKQVLRVKAIVSSSPSISPIRNLRAYDQITDLKPTPEAEVVSLGSSVIGTNTEPGIVFTLRKAGSNTFPNPPDQGDLYIVVDNPNQATPRVSRPPKLQLCSNSSCYQHIKLLATNFSESDFDKLIPATDLLQAQYTAAGGNFFTSGALPLPVTNVVGGNVYVLYSDAMWGTGGNNVPCCVSLIYIREVKDGMENNTNHQSAIEFRVINPVNITPF